MIAAWLLCIGLTVWLALRWNRSRRREKQLSVNFAAVWFLACALLPAVIYMAISINTNLNIGFRHLLPMYPMLAIAVAGAAGFVWSAHRWIGKAVAGALGLLLVVESMAIAPDYITFFNFAAGGQRGGLHRLGDSNLDWGQDLPSLAEWQKRNPDVTLYLAYFGRVDPAAYGIRYINMPGGFELNPQAIMPPANAVMAISATKVQAVYPATPELGAYYQQFLDREPSAVLGGTIYIFDQRRNSAPR
jgi:hypothetical protein